MYSDPEWVPSMRQIEIFNNLLYLKPFMGNRTTRVKLQCLKPFDSMKIELFVLDSNT